MPFTFSHPAIVLPLITLNRKWFSLTGLIIGSMTPDFEYFLRMSIKSVYSHTVTGLFWLDLPLGIFLAFIFHNIVRNNLFDNLPYFLKARFSVFKSFNWNSYFKRHWWVVIISILIGAASHMLWDSFTHGDGYFVQILPALAKNLEISRWQIPISKILQHGSTIVGGMIIIYAIYKLPLDKDTRTGEINMNYWTICCGLTLLIIAVRVFLCGLQFKQYGTLIVCGISAGLISLIITSHLIQIKKK